MQADAGFSQAPLLLLAGGQAAAAADDLAARRDSAGGVPGEIAVLSDDPLAQIAL